jgi:hypothetical protein
VNGRVAGVLIAQVERVDDPMNQGRIFVSFPTFSGSLESTWASVATPMAGNDRGFRFTPVVGDECLVAFDRSSADNPYVIGFLHNGVDAPPALGVDQRMICSVNGHLILFEDVAPESGKLGRLVIRDAIGNTIELDNDCMFIRGVGQLHIQAPIVNINGRSVMAGPGTI